MFRYDHALKNLMSLSIQWRPTYPESSVAVGHKKRNENSKNGPIRTKTAEPVNKTRIAITQ